MARIKWRGKQEWYPGKLERVELPKPVKEGGEWRTEASRKADFFVQLPFKEEKTLRKLKPHDFVPLFSTDTLCEIEVRFLTTKLVSS